VEAKITDVNLFRLLFQYISRFIEVAHFDIKENMFRVRSIDPHDFCYVDIMLYPNFFDEYIIPFEQSFSIDCSKLSAILPTLRSSEIFIKTCERHIHFSTKKDWSSYFSIKWLRAYPFNLPEPNTFKYEVTLELPATELADIIRKASTVSHEITFSAFPPNELTVSAAKEDYLYTAKLNNPISKLDIKQRVIVSTILDYLKILRPLINKCTLAKLFLGSEKPLRIDLVYKDKGIFSFSLSTKKVKKIKKKVKCSKEGTSLPRVSIKSFERYIVQLSRYPEGAEPEIFEMAGLETKGRDCWRLSNLLTLAYKDGRKIKLTPLGEAFVSLYEKDSSLARQFLHVVAKNTLPSYRVMMEKLSIPTTFNDLKKQINVALKSQNLHPITDQDLNTMVEIAKWCDVLKIKAGLLSLKNGAI